VGHVPDKLDRDQLRADLDGIVSLYRAGDDLRYKPAERTQGVRKIVETAKRLQSLIDGNWRLRRHRGALNRLIADAQSVLPEKAKAVLGVGQGVSAFENLVGRMLRSTFEQHFKIEAKVERPPDRTAVDRPACGPFIDFAEQCLTEFGITKNGSDPYSRESIAKALSDARTR
jgi:hypothetical protein